MNGGTIEVFGNGQEAVGNTMGGGSVTVHGHVGDTLGYAMRDGEIYVEKRRLARRHPYEGIPRDAAGRRYRRHGRGVPRRIYGGRDARRFRARPLRTRTRSSARTVPRACTAAAFSCAAKSRRRISANTLPCLRPMKRILRTWTASCANTAARASAGTRRKF